MIHLIIGGLFLIQASVPQVSINPQPAPENSIQTTTGAYFDTVKYIREVFGNEADNAIKIAQAESGLNPNAIHINKGGSVDRGIFQINSVHLDRVNGNAEALFDPKTNIKVAYEIFSEQGWCPWTTARKLGLCND